MNQLRRLRMFVCLLRIGLDRSTAWRCAKLIHP